MPRVTGGFRFDEPDVPADERPCLLVLRGANAGSRWTIREGVTTIGRHADSDVLLDDVSVSRRHAVAARTPDGVELRDEGSMNGTYLNGEVIDGVRRLRHGDCLQIGGYRLLFLA